MSESKLASVHVLKPAEVRTERRRLSAVQEPGRPKRGRWVMLAAAVFALAAHLWSPADEERKAEPDPYAGALFPGSTAEDFGPRQTPIVEAVLAHSRTGP